MTRPRKVIVRAKGGLGNQLFCYAAARRLALVSEAELVIDDVSGFARDHEYRRQYMLDHFQTPARKATPAERMEPFERYRRHIAKWVSRRQPFGDRRYVEQEKPDFDARLLDLRVNDSIYLDGHWQSERYFKDVEAEIRRDLTVTPPADKGNSDLADQIRSSNAVAVHIRWFDVPGTVDGHNVSATYYRRAVSLIEERTASARYFLFSDRPEFARSMVNVPEERTVLVSNNRGDRDAHADLWLMTLCRHFIIANSTFSWWGAWLAGSDGQTVICPGMELTNGTVTAWNFPGQLPERWTKV
jgi:hypothetical protein